MVTGASSGIGSEIARQLARRGLGVTLVARREDRLRTLADELSSTCNIRAEVVSCDLTERSSRDRLAQALDDRGLTVDVLVNNAGFGTTGLAHQMDRDRELGMIRTNVEALVDLCMIFGRGMADRGGGAILNVASTAAFQPVPGQAAYAATKSFVLSYSHSLRAELGRSGVSVTVLCPGPVDTEFADTAGFEAGEAEGAAPKFMWIPADRVAQEAVDGLARGKAVVIPGLANRLTAIGGYFAPRRVVTSLVASRHPALQRTRP